MTGNKYKRKTIGIKTYYYEDVDGGVMIMDIRGEKIKYFYFSEKDGVLKYKDHPENTEKDSPYDIEAIDFDKEFLRELGYDKNIQKIEGHSDGPAGLIG